MTHLHIVSDSLCDGFTHLFGNSVAGLAGHNFNLGVTLGSMFHRTDSHTMMTTTMMTNTMIIDTMMTNTMITATMMTNNTMMADAKLGVGISFSLDKTAVAQTDDTKKN